MVVIKHYLVYLGILGILPRDWCKWLKPRQNQE
jgi:hypothetical protein